MARFISHLPSLLTVLSFILPFCRPVAAKRQLRACKAVPGSEGWPPLEEWASLNRSVDGRLLQPIPPGAACHEAQAAHYNAAACGEVQAAWFTEPLHSNDPVSSMWNNWNNDTCLPDPALPCSAAGYPVYVVNASTAQHVKAGIDFARMHNIRLIVKNSGHDYLGRSSAPGSLSIWVHHMKEIRVHEESSFRPTGCNVSIPLEGGRAVTAGAGTQMLEAYRATALHNLTVVGGNGRTVALGGFITGGGHSILAPHYGMAADQVLEMELVTPTGEIVTSNECQHADLFWAMRGGGGSTFGVLTSITLKAIPSPEVMSLAFQLSTPASNPHALDAITYFVSKLPDLGDADVSGYPIIFRSAAAATSTVSLSGIIGKVIMLHTRDPRRILVQLEPVVAHINATWSEGGLGWTWLADTTYFPSFGAWYEQNYDPSPVGYGSVMGSRLLDRGALAANLTATKAALDRFSSAGDGRMAPGLVTAYIVSGKAVWEAKPRGGSTAVNPAWRRTHVHATASFSFAPLNATARAMAISQANAAAAALREVSQDMGAYVNEASRYEPDWQQVFWGQNYRRLLQIKRAVDPDDVFWCQPCVGNERWEEVEGMLCRV